MALAATVQYRVKTTGAEISGGGFDPALTAGMLTDGAATSATGTAPVFTSASYNFVAGDVGAMVYIASGTNWTPGWYPIASVAANAATLTAAVDSLRGGALLANNTPLTASGCATTASPTGATFSVDYSSLASHKLALTDLVSTASTTMTSAAAGFTPVMVGNILRLASATGTYTAAYYALTTYTNTTTMVADRVSGTYTLGVAKVGGAHASLVNYSNGGSGLSSPAIATPLIAGNTVKIYGAGSENPTSTDYDYSAGYWSFPNADTSGRINFIGVNGRPRIAHCGLLFYANTFGEYKNLFFIQTSGAQTIYAVSSAQSSSSHNCVFDQGGYDATQCLGGAVNCFFKNSGSLAAGTSYVARSSGNYVTGFFLMGNTFENIRGGAILGGGSGYAGNFTILNNIIRNCRGTASGMSSISLNSVTYGNYVIGNTLDAGLGDGINVADATEMALSTVMNNIISNHTGSGKYGINCPTGTTVANDAKILNAFNYNNIYNCTTSRNAHSAGVNDIALDPGFTNPVRSTTFTVTIASPAVFTHTAHGHVAGDIIWPTTTGALPTGLTASNPYFVISAGLTANAYEVSATLGGSAVNTSGSQSGVHTSTYVNGVADYSVGTNMKAAGFPSLMPG